MVNTVCLFLKKSWTFCLSDSPGSIVLKFIKIHVTQRSQSLSQTTACEYRIGNSRLFKASMHIGWWQCSHYMTSNYIFSFWIKPGFTVNCAYMKFETKPCLVSHLLVSLGKPVILTWWSSITDLLQRGPGCISTRWCLVDMLHACWMNLDLSDLELLRTLPRAALNAQVACSSSMACFCSSPQFIIIGIL